MNDIENIINKFKKIHNNKYDYSLMNYINNKTKVEIICPVHGSFMQEPRKHLYNGCPECWKKERSRTQENFILRSKLIHNNKYDYSLVNYTRGNIKVKIKCNVCNTIFEQTPDAHLRGQGCNNCNKISMTKEWSYVEMDFIKKHGNKYIYDNTTYKNCRSIINIYCKRCNKYFKQPISRHYSCGCPHCRRSRGEENVQKYLKSNNIRFENQKRFEDCRNKYALPFDFYLTDLDTCIEFDGVQHYIPNEYFGGREGLEQRQNNDKIKTDYCKNNGIKLIRIKYDEDIDFMLNKFLI